MHGRLPRFAQSQLCIRPNNCAELSAAKARSPVHGRLPRFAQSPPCFRPKNCADLTALRSEQVRPPLLSPLSSLAAVTDCGSGASPSHLETPSLAGRLWRLCRRTMLPVRPALAGRLRRRPLLRSLLPSRLHSLAGRLCRRGLRENLGRLARSYNAPLRKETQQNRCNHAQGGARLGDA